jgi:hypothetical protein
MSGNGEKIRSRSVELQEMGWYKAGKVRFWLFVIHVGLRPECYDESQRIYRPWASPLMCCRVYSIRN